MKLADMIWKQIEPKFEESIEKAYVKGGEDMIRRFAFVYDAVAKTAKADAFAQAGAIEIPEISKDEFDKLAKENLI